MPAKQLQGDGRGGPRPVAKRGRCVSCYARAPPAVGGKVFMKNGDYIPHVSRAWCDVCRVLLCKTCFYNVYDHRCGGKPFHYLTLR